MDRREREALDRWITTDPENQPSYINLPDDSASPEPPELPEDYDSWPAPCGHEVFGTPMDIDSGIRKHLEYCEEWSELYYERD